MRRKATVSAKAGKSSLGRRMLLHPVGKTLVALAVFGLSAGLIVFGYYYHKYATLTDEKLINGPFANTSKLYASSHVVSLGDESSPEEIVSSLRRAGYGTSRGNRMGWFSVRPDAVEVYPGVDSYFQQEAHVVRFRSGKVFRIISLRDSTERTQFWLEPELITNLFDRNREKRRFVQFSDIPAVVVNAVLSAEDKRFFQHAGFDPFRIIKSAYIDIKSQSNAMGASTLSMQLARELWLTKERTWQRKIPEVLITLHLERKLTKEEIFEHYANQIYLGRVGSFNIHGFGQGAQVFFDKDLRQLSLSEAALLAGVIQSPNRHNPLRNPDRGRQRRNIVLRLMRDNGYIDTKEYEEAAAAPLGVVSGSTESEDAPYFVDLVNDELQKRFQDHDFQSNSYRVYTTLDPNLQRAAAEAMEAGLKEIDERMAALGRTTARGWPPVQAALVALDPHTGEVRALVGGRDYGVSQLNRSVARRQPGSVFKPFVYAAALNTSLEGGPNPITPITTVMDEPTTFWFDEKPYEPGNFGNEFHGLVTLREALTKSINVPAVKFAEYIGYDRIVDLARRAGMSLNIQPTPALALGAYEVRPIEIAGAYTVFANHGVYLEPSMIKLIRDQDGKVIFSNRPVERQVLDPRIAYMMVDLMEEVLRSGTGVGVRARGFALPAAGKTGTSHDGWFAGFTSELICIVWVGYDDNRELKVEGSRSALPIWTEFMKRAHRYRPYRAAGPFEAPDGILHVDVDPRSGKLAAGGGCGAVPRTEVFLAGTQPLDYCNGSSTQVLAWDLPQTMPAGGTAEEGEESASAAPRQTAGRRSTTIPVNAPPVAAKPVPEPKKGFFGRLLDLFR